MKWRDIPGNGLHRLQLIYNMKKIWSYSIQPQSGNPPKGPPLYEFSWIHPTCKVFISPNHLLLYTCNIGMKDLAISNVRQTTRDSVNAPELTSDEFFSVNKIVFLTSKIEHIYVPLIFCHPHFTTMGFHFRKFNSHYILFNFTLFYRPPT